MTVLVTGVRGSVGRRVAADLHRQNVDVRGTSANADGTPDAPYPVAHVDLRSPDGLPGALAGVDRVFLYAAHEGIDKVVAHLAASDIEHVVVLSSASVELPGSEVLAHHHKLVEDTVAAAGLPWTFLRPGAFAANTFGWAADARAGLVALPYPDAYVEPIHEADIADAATALLTENHRGDRAYYMTGGESMTQREQVQTIAEAVGRDIEIDELSPDEWAARMSAFMPAIVAQALLEMWCRAVGRPGRTDAGVPGITAARPRSFAQWVAENVDKFR